MISAETKMETLIDAFCVIDRLPACDKNEKLKRNISYIFDELQMKYPRIAKRVLNKKGYIVQC